MCIACASENFWGVVLIIITMLAHRESMVEDRHMLHILAHLKKRMLELAYHLKDVSVLSDYCLQQATYQTKFLVSGGSLLSLPQLVKCNAI